MIGRDIVQTKLAVLEAQLASLLGTDSELGRT